MENFKLVKVDPYNCSIEELEKEIKRITSISDEYYDREQATKIWINSCYGALGSAFYQYYNPDIAEAITLQGQDVDKFANSTIDYYFKNIWHADIELHKELGLTYVNKLNINTLTIYQDTDSDYVSFDSVVNSCDYKGDVVDFIIKIKEFRLKKYLTEKFEEYAKKFNTINIQDLEMEKISYSVLMLAKKKYVLDLAWKDSGVRYKPQDKLKPVGVEVVQGSTPPFAKKVIKELLLLVFQKNKDLQYIDVVKKLKEYKKEFVMQNPEQISKTQSLGDYEKYVLEDKNEIRLAEKCPMNNRAAAVYNHKLLNSKWKTKYNLIKTSDKMKYYYSTSKEEVFGYLPNNYPLEFAPPVDYDKQFQTVIIDPFNRFIEAIGLNAVPGNLIVCKSLF